MNRKQLGYEVNDVRRHFDSRVSMLSAGVTGYLMDELWSNIDDVANVDRLQCEEMRHEKTS